MQASGGHVRLHLSGGGLRGAAQDVLEKAGSRVLRVPVPADLCVGLRNDLCSIEIEKSMKNHGFSRYPNVSWEI